MKKILCVLLAVLMLAGCARSGKDSLQTSATTVTDATTEASTATQSTTQATTVTEATTAVTTEPVPTFSRVRIVCAGDNLIHSSIYNQARRRAKAQGLSGYDFGFVYQAVEPYIAAADLAILNQETLVTDEIAPSDYPRFTSPGDLGRHMLAIGFDVFSISNNHILDKGEEGLLATLRFWEQEGGLVYGAYKDAADMENIRILEKNGITFAFLGYMEHTNQLKLPADATAEITYLSELELIEKQVRLADELADVVVVSPHYGVETKSDVTEKQREITQKLVDWGADLIIGTQPHTVQTCEFIERADGTKAFVYYCLGNLVSAQEYFLTMVGVLGDLEVVKNDLTGEIFFENVTAIPVVTHYSGNYQNIRVIPLAQYTPELLAEHSSPGFTQNTIDHIVGQIPEEFLDIR